MWPSTTVHSVPSEERTRLAVSSIQCSSFTVAMAADSALSFASKTGFCPAFRSVLMEVISMVSMALGVVDLSFHWAVTTVSLVMVTEAPGAPRSHLSNSLPSGAVKVQSGRV